MKSLKTIIMVMFTVFAFATTAIAEPHPSLSKKNQHTKKVDDLITQMAKADADMESAYNKATFIVTEGSPEKENLIEAQRVWKVYRALMGDVVKAMNMDMGGYGDIVIKKHYIGITKRRAEELKYISTGPEDPPTDY